jgi:hypothetical protein
MASPYPVWLSNPIKRLKASVHCEPVLFQIWPNPKRK